MDELEALLALALSQPLVALTTARRLLEAHEPPVDERTASYAHQAITVVERDRGHLAVALRHARAALRLARSSSEERVADVLATYGLTLVHAGRTTDGLRRLDAAVLVTTPVAMPRLLLRRANALYQIGRYADARVAIDDAVAGSRESGDLLWLARGLNNRCVVNLALGEVDAADADAREAETLFAGQGQVLESAHSLHNRALAAHARGDLPEALRLLDAVTARYAEIQLQPADLVIDHAATLLTAGLTAESAAMVARALATADVPPIKRAELLLRDAEGALSDGRLDEAATTADRAARLFANQGRPRWTMRARVLRLEARYCRLAAGADGDGVTDDAGAAAGADGAAATAPLLPDARRLVGALRRAGATELPDALLLHGRVALAAGRRPEAVLAWEAAAPARHTGAGLARAAGWLAAALIAEQRGDRRALLHACRRGLDAVDEHRALLGSLELRALASRHGAELATLAVRAALTSGSARSLLWWVERWRATALAAPPARPDGSADGGELDREIAALRDLSRRAEAADGTDLSTDLRAERARSEARVRRAYRHVRGAGPAGGRGGAGFDLDALMAGLGETSLVSLLSLDGRLYAVTASGGHVRRRAVGPLADALREAQYARFMLRRAAYGRRCDLDATARRLQAAVLGAAAPAAGSVVLVPPAELLTVPWGLLPAFANTVLTVSPSVTLWAAARDAARTDGPIALVTGPGLSTGENEVTGLSPLHDRARSVGGAHATVAAALEVLDGARLAHIAAHGTFRADAPLFSSLALADGPLMVHDLDRLARPPSAVVLSACDSGNAAPIGSHEALGLVGSLLSMGTASVLASVVPVNDHATVRVMQRVHEVAGSGGSLAQGWAAARADAGEDPVTRATAAAFTAWGA